MRDRDFEDFRRFVAPLAPARLRAFGEPDRIHGAAGVELVADDGRRVLDFLAGWGTQPFGHRPAAVEARLREFLDGREPALYTSGVSPYAGRLARELCRRSGLDRAFFASGGTEAVEAAVKLARAATGRRRVLHLEGAYHGCTMGSLALMAQGPFREPFGPHVPEVEPLPFGDVEALRASLERGPAAAVVVEPVQVEGGVRPVGEAYLAALGEEADRRGFVLVADEIQTGLGRTGRFLASGSWPRGPDAVVLGKALGGGLLPISCLLGDARLFDRAYGTPETAELHYSTFGGGSLACVAALATLESLDDSLLAAAAGARLAERLAEALRDRPAVKAVRGAGLLAGIELAGGGPGSSLGLWLCRRLLRAGYYTGLCAHDGSTVRVHPPLTTSTAEIDAFVEVVAREARLLEQSDLREP